MMNFDKTEIRVQKSPWSFGLEMLIRNGDAVVKDVTFEPVEKYTVVNPSLTISPNIAQQLMDDLWTAGIRPSEGTGSAGSLAATERHLKDMRDIVFQELKFIRE